MESGLPSGEGSPGPGEECGPFLGVLHLHPRRERETQSEGQAGRRVPAPLPPSCPRGSSVARAERSRGLRGNADVKAASAPHRGPRRICSSWDFRALALLGSDWTRLCRGRGRTGVGGVNLPISAAQPPPADPPLAPPSSVGGATDGGGFPVPDPLRFTSQGLRAPAPCFFF